MSAAEAVGGSVREHRGGAGPATRPRQSQGTMGASWRLLRSEMRLILGRRRNKAGVLVLAAVPGAAGDRAAGIRPGSEGGGPT